jgi:CheY-like chemotaxis protein
MYDFRVKGAHTAQLALQLADELQPDLIITDIEKPDMNGLDMLTRLKASSAVQHIPVVVHTGYGDSYRQRSMDVGAVAFITKPYDIDDLVTIIEDVLGVERTSEDWSLVNLNRLTTEQA